MNYFDDPLICFKKWSDSSVVDEINDSFLTFYRPNCSSINWEKQQHFDNNRYFILESYKTENPQIEEADNWNFSTSSEWFISQLSTLKLAPNYFVHQLTVFLGKKILNVNIFFPPHWQTLIVWSFQKHWSNFLPFSDILKTTTDQWINKTINTLIHNNNNH